MADAARRRALPPGVARSLPPLAVNEVPQRRGGVTVWREAGAGPALVLLHGGSGAWTHWVANVASLAGRYRLLIPDMPGYGTSDGPPETVEDMADEIARGVGALTAPDEPLALVGFSFGSLVAALTARRLGRPLRRLVLVGPGGLGGPTSRSLPMRPWRKLVDPRERHAAHRHNLLTLMLAREDSATPEAVAIHSAAVEAARFNSRQLSEEGRLRAALAPGGLPLAAIWGEADPLIRDDLEERIEAVRAADPDAPVRMVPGAGHWVPFEAPEAFDAALSDVL